MPRDTKSGATPSWALPWLTGAVVLGHGAAAEAQPPAASGARATIERPRVEARPTETPSPVMLAATLPAAAPLVLFAPRAGDFSKDLDALLELAGAVEHDLAGPRRAAKLMHALVGGEALDAMREGGHERMASNLERFLDPDQAMALGLDMDEPLLLVPGPDDGALALSLGVRDRARLEAALDAALGPPQHRVQLGGAEVVVRLAEAERPVSCVVGAARAQCQIGLISDDAPLALLEALLRSGRDVPLARASGLARALAWLPPGARTYVLFSPHATAEHASRLARAQAEKANRFDRQRARRRADAAERGKAQRLRSLVAGFEGAALGVYAEGERWTLRLETALSASGARWMEETFGSEPVDPVIARWASTPALFSLLARLQPGALEELAAGLGIPMPRATLDGTLALLTLGVDAQCPLASKRASLDEEWRWAFLLPTAIAAGLREPAAASRVHAALAERLGEAPASEPAQVPPFAGAQVRSALRGEAFGSPFEVDILDDLLLAGTGPGMGAAALRRLSALPSRAEPAPGQRPFFFEANLDLRAFDAALASGGFGEEHRAELGVLETLRQKLEPLVEAVRRVQLRAQRFDDGRRVRVEALLGG